MAVLPNTFHQEHKANNLYCSDALTISFFLTHLQIIQAEQTQDTETCATATQASARLLLFFHSQANYDLRSTPLPFILHNESHQPMVCNVGLQYEGLIRPIPNTTTAIIPSPYTIPQDPIHLMFCEIIFHSQEN